MQPYSQTAQAAVEINRKCSSLNAQGILEHWWWRNHQRHRVKCKLVLDDLGRYPCNDSSRGTFQCMQRRGSQENARYGKAVCHVMQVLLCLESSEDARERKGSKSTIPVNGIILFLSCIYSRRFPASLSSCKYDYSGSERCRYKDWKKTLQNSQ